LLHALVTPADVQDRDGGLMVLSTLFGQFPFLKKLFADTAYAGPVFQDGLALAMPGLVTEIVRRCDQAKGFVVLLVTVPNSGHNVHGQNTKGFIEAVGGFLDTLS